LGGDTHSLIKKVEVDLGVKKQPGEETHPRR